MNNEIVNIEFELPSNICRQVCIVSFLLAGFLGWFYDFWGIAIAGLGGLAGAWLWCKYMRKIFALPTRSTVAIYASGILLGVAVGVADGVLLHVIGMNLQKAGWVTVGEFSQLGPRTYTTAIIMGTSWGTFAGLVNGTFWGQKISQLHENAWKYMNGVAQNVAVNEHDFADITQVVRITKRDNNDQ